MTPLPRLHADNRCHDETPRYPRASSSRLILPLQIVQATIPQGISPEWLSIRESNLRNSCPVACVSSSTLTGRKDHARPSRFTVHRDARDHRELPPRDRPDRLKRQPTARIASATAIPTRSGNSQSCIIRVALQANPGSRLPGGNLSGASRYAAHTTPARVSRFEFVSVALSGVASCMEHCRASRGRQANSLPETESNASRKRERIPEAGLTTGSTIALSRFSARRKPGNFSISRRAGRAQAATPSSPEIQTSGESRRQNSCASFFTHRTASRSTRRSCTAAKPNGGAACSAPNASRVRSTRLISRERDGAS